MLEIGIIAVIITLGIWAIQEEKKYQERIKKKTSQTKKKKLTPKVKKHEPYPQQNKTAKQEAERIVKEKAAKEKAEKERIAKEKAEQEKKRQEEAAKQEAERIAKEKALKEKAEKERIDKEKAAQEKKRQEEAERIAKEKAAKEKAEKERIAKEKEAEAEAKKSIELPKGDYPPFDYSRLLEMGLSDTEAYEFVEELIPQIETQIPLIQEAIDAGDFHQMERLTHSIKGSSTTVGTGGVADLLVDYNTYLKSGTEIEVAKAYQEHLKDHLEKLKAQFS